tara:strand:+ start:15537 stop:16784 length:1248 start_codon:yes stop_codon:yes gene_type:complete
MSRTRLRDLSVIEAAIGINSGLSEQTLMNAAARNGDDITDVISDASSSRHSNASLGDWLAARVEVLDPTYRGPWTTPALLRENARIDAELGAEIGASAGMSTMTGVSGLLSNLANKHLEQGYANSGAASSLKKLAKRVLVKDFKKNTALRVGLGDLLGPLGPGGEVKSTTLNEDQTEFNIGIFARSLTVTEEALANDDLGAIEGAEVMGAAASRTEELEAASLFSEAASAAVSGQPSSGEFFFGTNAADGQRANYLTGSTSALSIDSLSAAYQKLKGQVDRSGDPVDLQPTHLITTGANEVLARQLCTATEIRPSGATDRDAPISNPFAGNLEPIASPWLQSARIVNPLPDGAWFLAAVSRTTAPVILAHRVGHERPTVRVGPAAPNQLAMNFMVRLDFGTALHDRRSIVCSAGA